MECVLHGLNEVLSQSASVKKLNSTISLSRKTEYSKSEVRTNISASRKNGKQSCCYCSCGDISHLANKFNYIHFQ